MRRILWVVIALCLGASNSIAQEPAKQQTTPLAVAEAPPAPPPAENAAPNPVSSAPAEAAPASPDSSNLEARRAEAAQAFYNSLHRQTGAITLLGGKVVLTVPETHYFIGPEDTRRVIVDVWGNPPEAAQGVLGMVFLADANPINSWGATIEYMNDGHVDDGEAERINYTDLLHNMQNGVRDHNAERVRQGYPELYLDGWAESPHYNRAAHTLFWAKLLSTSNGVHSLNYDVRVLGRDGVLVMSLIANPEELALMRNVAPAVMAMPVFTPGNRYADFRQGVDRVAEYGIGGLIAGGALAAVAQKTGLIAIILAFGKKLIVLIVAAGAAIMSFVRRLFGGKSKPEA